MKNIFLLLAVYLLCCGNLLSQDYKDCGSALMLCGESPFILQMTEGIGEQDPGIQDLCVQVEVGSTWLELTAETAGDIVFELISEDLTMDLDFVVYRVANGDCDTKEAIRCMASGETAGLPSEACEGATGLAYGETDVVEAPGCNNGDNNYLAPLQAEAGDQFKILINEFSQSGVGVEMTIGGTARLECISTATEQPVGWTTSIYPNPSKGSFTISSAASTEQVTIYDVQGRLVWNAKYTPRMSVSSDQLGGAGVYHVVLQTSQGAVTRRAVVLE